ncbi:MAG: hypothetical protein JNJ44_03700 [Zoogloeaceae bacterium]|nr:hypothetical protein [Zoogloeaceae bacterium]
MAKPHELDFFEWNNVVDSFHGESDRGAAIIAAGFVDNYLGIYLRSLATDSIVADALFHSMGPLSSFNQRITIARAFDFVSKQDYEDLTLIRKIRNHFAHHPLDTTFGTQEVFMLSSKLSDFDLATEAAAGDPTKQSRYAYLLSCGRCCAEMYIRMGRQPA